MAGTWVKRIEGTVETSSRLRVWWLNSFQGYHVLEERLSPRKRLFGGVSYGRVWILKSGHPKA